MTRWILTLLFCATSVAADIVTPLRTLRPGSLIELDDLTVRDGAHDGAFDRISDVVGQETRLALYAGRPILFEAVGPPSIVNRNEIVALRFHTAGLTITTEGRAMERGSKGDRIRVMNLQSRTTLFGLVQGNGTVKVIQ